MSDSPSGRTSGQQKKHRLADAIAKDVMEILHYGEESVSVAMEEVKFPDWVEKVHQADLRNNLDKLYKEPACDDNDL